jgi:hypothetical protein
MPTREVLASFWRDWDRLTLQQQRAFREALVQFIADIADGGQSFHPASARQAGAGSSWGVGDDLGAGWPCDLRVRRGGSRGRGARHWRRIGTHSVFRRP